MLEVNLFGCVVAGHMPNNNLQSISYNLKPRTNNSLMASGDIYVLVTASSDLSGRSKSVVVLVPGKVMEEHRSKTQSKKIDDRSIAQELADPLASYVFTHRSTFGAFKVAHSFSKIPPPGIDRECPELTRGELRAWLL